MTFILEVADCGLSERDLLERVRFQIFQCRALPIASQYVKLFVERNKNGAVDAEAICVAATCPEMPAVPVKTASQQAIPSIHRTRQGVVEARIVQANQSRGLLAEFSFVISQGINLRGKSVPGIIVLPTVRTFSR